MGYRGHAKDSYANATGRVKLVRFRRSQMAREIGESLDAPRARTENQWLRQPNKFDIPNIDTPKSLNEKTEPKRNYQSRFPQPSNQQRETTLKMTGTFY